MKYPKSITRPQAPYDNSQRRRGQPSRPIQRRRNSTGPLLVILFCLGFWTVLIISMLVD